MAEACSTEGSTSTAESRRNNKLRQGFVSLAESLLESISDVFPECDQTQTVLRIFRAIVKGNVVIEDRFIRRCHVAFNKNSEGIRAKSAEALFVIVESIEHVSEIDLREKWEDPEFTQESKDHLWQYIATLKTYADLYTALPPNVLGQIENMAGALGEQFLTGQLDLKSVDIGALGRDIMSNLSAEDIARFEGNLPEIYESITNVTRSLGGTEGANIDIPALMQQLSVQLGETQGGGLDMTKVLQAVTASSGTQGQGVDIAQLLQTLTPLISAMRPPVNKKRTEALGL